MSAILSVLLVVLLVLIGIELVYYLAPGGDQDWSWLTPGAVLAVGLWLATSFVLRMYVAYFGAYNARDHPLPLLRIRGPCRRGTDAS